MIGRSNPPKRGTRINLTHPLFRDLVGYWPLQEAAGVIVPDGSGLGRNGTLKNMDPATDWTVANRGAALDFDGTNDFVDLGNVLDPGTKDFSISYWALIRNTDAQAYRVIQKRGTGGFGLVGGFIFGSSGTVAGSVDRSYVDDGAGNYLRFDSTDYGFDDGAWHHFAFTFKNSTAAFKFYLDGIYMASAGVSGGTPAGLNITSSKNLTFGSLWDDVSTQSQFFNGKLANVMMFHRVLDPREIAILYSEPWAAFRGPSRVNALRVQNLVSLTELDDVIFLNEVENVVCESNLSHVSVWKNWGRTNLVSESRIDNISVTQTLLVLNAKADITLPALKCEASSGPRIRSDIDLPSLQCEAEALCGQIASADVELPSLTCKASFGGRASMELPALVAEASGLTGNVAAVSVKLPGLTVEAGSDRIRIDANVELPALIALATAIRGDTIRGDADIPALRAEAHAFAGEVASLDELLPALVAEAYGFADAIAEADIDLPALMCAASMRIRGRFDGLILRHIQIYRISAVEDLDTESVITEWPIFMP